MKNYIDLGLPSGNLWCDTNEEGYYSYEGAVKKFGDNMPKLTDIAELYDYCKWEWNEEKNGIIITGSNGNSIFLPAAGYRNNFYDSIDFVCLKGLYWSASAYGNNAYALYFCADFVSPSGIENIDSGYSIRLIKRK